MSGREVNVLLTDVELRKVFDLYNCLANGGCSAILASEKRFPNMLIYGRRINLLRKACFSDFNDDLLGIVRSIDADEIVYFPCEEDTTLLFYDFVEKNCCTKIKYALPDKRVFELVRNKRFLSRFCFENQVPCPREYSLAELEKDFCRVVAKPVIGTGSCGVMFVDKPEQLEKLECLNETEYIFQEWLPNSRNVCGAFFLFDHGKTVAYYGHKRIRTYPVKAGVSVYSKIEFDEDVRNTGEMLLTKLGWHGIAMVEFLYDPSEKVYKVVEVNPRLWGSVLLSEFSNTGLIENYIRISTGRPVVEHKQRSDVYLRWFFPFDLLNYISAKGKIADFWNFDKEKTCYVGFTYSSFLRSFAFLLFSMFDYKKVSKFLSKVMP